MASILTNTKYKNRNTKYKMKNSVKLKEIGELIMKISVIMITRVVPVKEGTQ